MAATRSGWIGLLALVVLVGCSSPDAPADDPQRNGAPPIAGCTYTSWDSAGFRTGAATGAMAEMVMQTAATWVMICVTEYHNATTDAIAPDAQGTSTEEDLRAAIVEAHGRGLKVLLTPHVDTYTGAWRASMTPTDAWFRSYEQFIRKYAQLARSTQCEMFCIGTELVRATQPNYDARWRAIIAAIRADYNGPLTYAANWNGYPQYGIVLDEYEQITFWSALDYIGIDWYAPYGAFTDRYNRIHALSTATGVPVLLTETGCPSVEGALERPWDYTSLITAGNPASESTQRTYYDAVIHSFGKAEWCKGLFWWNWESIPSTLESKQYTPRNKSAAPLVKAFYQGAV